jgi:hypothetical protein
MPPSIGGNSIDAAVRNPDDMRRLLNGIAGRLAMYDDQLGLIDGFLDDPTDGTANKPAPPAAGFVVKGVDGKFEIQITLPQDAQPQTVTLYRASFFFDRNRARADLVHQVQSATNMLFDSSGNVTTYGPTPETSLSITNPNVTLFWRLRSSYDQLNWNDWQIFSSASACGPIGVSSGFLRSTSGAPNMSVNSSNNATVNSIDAGSSVTIRVYGPGGPGTSWTRFDGQAGQTTIPSGTLTGRLYNTTYWVVYAADTGYATYTLDQFNNVLMDQLLWAGKITTVSSGGGGGTTGGGGGGTGGGDHGGGLGGLLQP